MIDTQTLCQIFSPTEWLFYRNSFLSVAWPSAVFLPVSLFGVFMSYIYRPWHLTGTSIFIDCVLLQFFLNDRSTIIKFLLDLYTIVINIYFRLFVCPIRLKKKTFLSKLIRLLTCSFYVLSLLMMLLENL